MAAGLAAAVLSRQRVLSPSLKLHNLPRALLIEDPVATFTALDRLPVLQASATATAATDIVAGSIRPGGVAGAVAAHAAVSVTTRCIVDPTDSTVVLHKAGQPKC